MNMEDYSFTMPGRIVEYFPDTQTATVRICSDKTYSNSVEDNAQKVRELLQDVPVFTPSGGGWAITFPIKPGDTCQLTFSQFGYDHWLFGDKDSAGLRSDGNPLPWTYRRFSLADGFALVGYNTLPKAIKSYSDDGSEWRNEDTSQRISLKDNGDIEVSTTTQVTVTAPQVVVEATSVTVEAEEIEVTCPISTINGDVEVNGEVTANGIPLSTHTHPGDGGVGSGPIAGPPQI